MCCFINFFARHQLFCWGESAAASALVQKRLKITKEVAAAADRVKLTSRGSPPRLLCHRADQGVLSPPPRAIRQHRKVKETAEAAVKDYRKPNTGARRGSHLRWDGKLLPGSESQGHVDRLAIVVTSPPLKEKSSWLSLPCHPVPEKQWPAKIEETIRHWKFEDRVGGAPASTPPLQTRASCWLLHTPRTELVVRC
ncbi:hypothetical protein GWK47_012019 [Chionoecetes opilio]|uniref:Uncharacterized protein n=1 Tax=Chionoecetes opilio TaxID=41210 RepID=A0A8J5CMK7_CHIOP|nr:hypothetical protein GWK47_012019 [Chionoecetes opilio]